jgi:hypothetical protein
MFLPDFVILSPLVPHYSFILTSQFLVLGMLSSLCTGMFARTQYPTAEEFAELAQRMDGVSEKQIRLWFKHHRKQLSRPLSQKRALSSGQTGGPASTTPLLQGPDVESHRRDEIASSTLPSAGIRRSSSQCNSGSRRDPEAADGTPQYMPPPHGDPAHQQQQHHRRGAPQDIHRQQQQRRRPQRSPDYERQPPQQHLRPYDQDMQHRQYRRLDQYQRQLVHPMMQVTTLDDDVYVDAERQATSGHADRDSAFLASGRESRAHRELGLPGRHGSSAGGGGGGAAVGNLYPAGSSPFSQFGYHPHHAAGSRHADPAGRLRLEKMQRLREEQQAQDQVRQDIYDDKQMYEMYGPAAQLAQNQQTHQYRVRPDGFDGPPPDGTGGNGSALPLHLRPLRACTQYWNPVPEQSGRVAEGVRLARPDQNSYHFHEQGRQKHLFARDSRVGVGGSVDGGGRDVERDDRGGLEISSSPYQASAAGQSLWPRKRTSVVAFDDPAYIQQQQVPRTSARPVPWQAGQQLHEIPTVADIDPARQSEQVWLGCPGQARAGAPPAKVDSLQQVRGIPSLSELYVLRGALVMVGDKITAEGTRRLALYLERPYEYVRAWFTNEQSSREFMKYLTRLEVDGQAATNDGYSDDAYRAERRFQQRSDTILPTQQQQEARLPPPVVSVARNTASLIPIAPVTAVSGRVALPSDDQNGRGNGEKQQQEPQRQGQQQTMVGGEVLFPPEMDRAQMERLGAGPGLPGGDAVISLPSMPGIRQPSDLCDR